MIRVFFALFAAGLMPLLAQDVNLAGQRFPEVALPQATRAAGIAGVLGQQLPEVARWYGMTAEELQAVAARDRSMIVDQTGRLAYVCAGIIPGEEMEAAASEAVTPQAIVYPPAQTFFLHSRPGANRKIYLDFDGHTTSGTIWNNNFNSGNNFTTPRYDIDGNTSGFNSTELSRIQAIWKRVAEDFAPYDVDVTTEDPGVEALRRVPGSDQVYGIRVCIGGSSYDWYRSGAGGVAYVGSFNWTSDTPCYVFTAQLGSGNEGFTAEATSHEVGHTLGLHHDGQTNGTEYYTGHGNWAPIMGVGYNKQIVQWSRGEYPLANNTQDDTAVMQNFGAPLRADDAGDDFAGAVPMFNAGVVLDGVIHTRADRDVYTFSTGAGPVSFTTDTTYISPNLDVMLTLYDVAGNVLAVNNPSGMTTALTTNLAAGTYYVSIEGTAPGNPLTSYNDYGSLGAYEFTAIYQSTVENFVSVVASDAEAAETPRLATPNTGTFRFSRLISSPQAMTVPFDLSGTAISGTHFTMPAIATIPGGALSGNLTVTPIDNDLPDGVKTVTVTLRDSPFYSLANAKQATVTIRDNELPVVNVIAAVTQTPENSATPVSLTVYRDSALATPLAVKLAVTGTAEAGVDFEPLPASVVIPGGATQTEVPLQPIDNASYNAARTVIVTVAQDLEYNPGFQTSATIRILNDDAPPDTSNPVVTIASPKAKQRFETPVSSLMAGGTAKDNLGVTRVRYRVNGGDWKDATLNAGGWSADVAADALPGNNLLEVQSEDSDANGSNMAAVTFAVVKRRSLEVAVSGPGSVTPGGGQFEANQNYVLKAKPAPGKIFAGWTGGLTGSGKVMAFTMPDEDLQVTATFVENPFSPGIIGKYTGLLEGPTIATATAGMVTLGVTKTGMATGKIVLGGKAFNFRGEFSGMGALTAAIGSRKGPKLQLTLQLDMNPNGSQSITGTIAGAGEPSTVLARRAPYDKRANPLGPEYARSFTFFLPPDAPASIGEGGPQDSSLPDGDDSAPKPRGYGVGTLSISTSGVVKWAGTLGDGTPAVQTSLLDGEKRWPLYLPLYKTQGFIGGEVAHDPGAPGGDLRAKLNWLKAPNPRDFYFPGGFRNAGHLLVGINYTAPAKGARVLPGYDAAPGNAGPLTFEEGNVPGDLAAGTLGLLATNATQPSPLFDKLKIKINARTGAVSGSFAFPITRKNTAIKGVILQGSIGKAFGVFQGSNLNNTSLQTGRIEFTPAPVP